MAETRDIVLIVTGIVWSLVWVAILAVSLAIFVVARKGLNSAQDFMRTRATPFVLRVQVLAEDARGKTAQFAGRPLPEGFSVVRPATAGRGFSLPRFRRRRTWWQRLLER
jgi:hypothetical protein